MKLFIPVAFALAFVSVALSDDENFKKNPKSKDFLGKWVGKWDDKWKVQFTITRDEIADHFAVVYEWEESVGKPMKKSQMLAKIDMGSLVMPPTGKPMIEISLIAKEKGKGKAKGNFVKPRSAMLTREKD